MSRALDDNGWTADKPQCPVRDLCLSYVIANETTATRWGIWGGTTPAQRERIHRRNRRRK